MSQTVFIVHHKFSKLDILQSSLSTYLPSHLHKFFPLSTLDNEFGDLDPCSQYLKNEQNTLNNENSRSGNGQRALQGAASQNSSLKKSNSSSNLTAVSKKKLQKKYTSKRLLHAFHSAQQYLGKNIYSFPSISEELNENVYNLKYASDALMKELQSISHKYLVKYFYILHSKEESNFYLISLDYYHNLQQEINFCLKNNQFPNKQRIEQIFHCILSGMKYLNGWKSLDGMLGDGFYGIWYPEDRSDYEIDNQFNNNNFNNQTENLFDNYQSDNKQSDSNQQIKSNDSIGKKKTLSVFKRSISQGIVHPSLTPSSISMSHKSIAISDYIDEYFIQSAIGVNRYFSNSAYENSSTNEDTTVNSKSTGKPINIKEKFTFNSDSQLNDINNVNNSETNYENERYRLMKAPTFKNRIDSLYQSDQLFHSNIIYVAPEYFVTYLEQIDLEVDFSSDTWSVAIIMLHYTLCPLFIETFFDTEGIYDNIYSNNLKELNSRNWEVQLKEITPQGIKYTLDGKNIDPLVFYTNIQLFREYYISQQPHNLSPTKLNNFNNCIQRLQNTLNSRDLAFIIEGIRMQDRKSISDLLAVIPSSNILINTTEIDATKLSFELSSLYKDYEPPTVFSTEDSNQYTQTKVSTMEGVDESVMIETQKAYTEWIEENSIEKVISFLNTRNSFITTPLLHIYPNIHTSTLHKLQNNDTMKDIISNQVDMTQYKIPSSILLQLSTNPIHEVTINNANYEDMNEAELYLLHGKQYSSLADVNGDLLKYKTKNTYTFSQMLTDNEQKSRYQYQRIELFRSLINDYPESRDRIISEARKDIPPVLRGEIWACILGVDKNYYEIFESIIYKPSLETNSMYKDCINKRKIDLQTDCDRQIAVDLPRCHQYHSKLNSFEGRKKLEVVLKAWVKYNKGKLVYWQGLDSICAPFVVLNYHDSALAFSCLTKLVEKYVPQFFLENNSHAMENQLCMFEKLLSYHEPQIAHHLDMIEFRPELYTIPWFLTMFSHVLPIEKIFKLWDHILLDTHHSPLQIAVSFLKQQRNELLNSDFNEVNSVLTNMHHIRIEKVIEDSFILQQKTPECILNPKCLQYITINEYKEMKYPRIVPDDLCFTDLFQIAIILDIQHPHNYSRRNCVKSYHIAPVPHRKHSKYITSTTSDEFENDLLNTSNKKSEDQEVLIENYDISENELTLLKSNVLHHLEYKRGIPIVLISDHPKIEHEVEKHLLHHNFPFVTIVCGGMKYFTYKHQQFVTMPPNVKKRN